MFKNTHLLLTGMCKYAALTISFSLLKDLCWEPGTIWGLFNEKTRLFLAHTDFCLPVNLWAQRKSGWFFFLAWAGSRSSTQYYSCQEISVERKVNSPDSTSSWESTRDFERSVTADGRPHPCGNFLCINPLMEAESCCCRSIPSRGLAEDGESQKEEGILARKATFKPKGHAELSEQSREHTCSRFPQLNHSGRCLRFHQFYHGNCWIISWAAMITADQSQKHWCRNDTQPLPPNRITTYRNTAGIRKPLNSNWNV